MNLSRILKEMYTERTALTESIGALERLVAVSRKRRGRPPR